MTQEQLDQFIEDHTAKELLQIERIALAIGNEKFPKGTTWDDTDRIEVWHTAILVWEHRQPRSIPLPPTMPTSLS